MAVSVGSVFFATRYHASQNQGIPLWNKQSDFSFSCPMCLCSTWKTAWTCIRASEGEINWNCCCPGKEFCSPSWTVCYFIVWLVANSHLAPRSFLTYQRTRLFNTPFLRAYNYWWLFQPRSRSIYIQLTGLQLVHHFRPPNLPAALIPVQIQCHQQPKEERPLAKIATAKPSLHPNSEANKHKRYNAQKRFSSWHCF